MKYLFFIFSFMTFSIAETTYSKEYNNCFQANSNLTTSDMLVCIYSETKRQDKRLNKNYKLSIESLSNEKAIELKIVQRLWIKYRNNKCNFYIGLTGGTKDKLTQADCFLEMTTKRADELDDISYR